MPDRFIFNDQRVDNSYGFSIRTAGIDITRFEKNPVMLDGHWNETTNTIGRWKDLQRDENTLSGVPEFDPEDEKAQVIAGKVERGFIRACSMGILFSREDMKLIGDKIVLEKCELMEVSIVAVPSNGNAIRLYAKETGELLTDDEVKQLTLSLQMEGKDAQVGRLHKEKPEKKEDMKIKLLDSALIALGYSAGTELDAATLSAKVIELSNQKKAVENELAAIKTKQEQEQLQAINDMVDTAVKEGKITADQKSDFVNLGVANFSLLQSTLNNLPAKQSLAGGIKQGGVKEVKTVDDFQKLSLQEQLEFKASNPEGYKNLFTKK